AGDPLVETSGDNLEGTAYLYGAGTALRPASSVPSLLQHRTSARGQISSRHRRRIHSITTRSVSGSLRCASDESCRVSPARSMGYLRPRLPARAVRVVHYAGSVLAGVSPLVSHLWDAGSGTVLRLAYSLDAFRPPTWTGLRAALPHAQMRQQRGPGRYAHGQ